MDNDKPAKPNRDRILLVDDNPSDLDTLGSLFQPHYDVLAAPSGKRALQVAASAAKPDLILLDVMMPDMDGYDVLDRLRDDPLTRDIPVIFVTGLDSTEDEEHGLELGAVDYIAKPYRPPIILARVHNQLELKHARDWLRDQNAYLEAEVERRMKESQQAHIQLLQSEKLATIGLLAAGVAHEINNPIGYITSNLASLESYLSDIFDLLDAYEALEGASPSCEAALSRIREIKQQKEIGFLRADIGHLMAESREGLVRVAKIVSDLKDFSRAESNDWQWANLHDGLEAILGIAWNEISCRCTLRKDYGDIPEIYCIPSQIDQVFLNLLVNAAQAITDKGEITLRTGQVGDEVFVAIADNGVGIADDDLSRLFEPFFTTKPVGKGTGLGLSIAYGIVQKHKGRIEVKSAVGQGTAFTVWLPAGLRVDENRLTTTGTTGTTKT
jgi:two-component system, NtrC family, sensor kinase